MSVAGSPSLALMSVEVSRNNQGVSRRLSAPHINSRDPPQGPSTNPTPSKPTFYLKLYPWMTQPEDPPPKDPSDNIIRCPYPTNSCAETLPKNPVIWRRHLANKHGLTKDSVPQTCQWPECGMTMGGRSLNRHVLMKHMDFKTSCPHCKVRRRYDHMEKHISNCSSNPAREVDRN